MRVIAYVLLMGGVQTALAADTFESVGRDIERLRIEQGIASIAVAVSRHGKIIWEQGFGWADRENRIPASQHTMYAIASVSKPYTATALMTLVQAGRIDLDRPINSYLGDAKLLARVGDARDATVRRVATHTSGLPAYAQSHFEDEPCGPSSFDTLVGRFGNLVTAPGERFQYSNLGYGLLGYAIARNAGIPFAVFMREQVFDKLGLNHTSVGITPALKVYQAIRYDDRGARIAPFEIDTPGAGAVYSSAHDVVRFGMFHLKDHLADQSAILSDSSLEAMHQTHDTAISEGTDDPDPRGTYAIGWRVRTQADGHRVVSHLGGMAGARAVLELVTDEDIAIVVLSNAGIGNPTSAPVLTVRDKILKSLLKQWLPPNPSAQTATEHAPISGVWKGMLHEPTDDLPIALTFLKSGEVQARLGNQLPTLVSDVRYREGWLSGRSGGRIDVGSVHSSTSYVLRYSLKLRGNTLNGSVSAVSEGTRGFELPDWVELVKQL